MELQLQDLRKQYGEKCAVNNVSANLAPGVYGLLGANGAGKTTLMRMICGVLKPTSGSIRLNGKTVEQLGEQYYTHLGYMPQDFGFYPDFTAREFMLYMAAVKGLDKRLAQKRTEDLLYMVNLSDVADKKIKSYSGGMKQRLGIAQAELNNPAILILDEPTAGLDPKERVRFRNRDSVHTYCFGCVLYCGHDLNDEAGVFPSAGADGDSYRQHQRQGMGTVG